MELLGILSKKQENLDNIGEEFGKKVEEAQNELLPLIFILLNSFDYEQDGRDIVFSTANYAKIDAFMEGINKAISEGKYYDALLFLTNKIDQQAELTKEMYRKMGLDVDSVKDVNYEELSALMLLDLTNLETGLYSFIRNFISASISTGSSRKDIEEGISFLIKGGDGRKGRLFDTAVLTGDTMFAVIDRSFTFAMGEVLGIKRYRYAGGIIKDSRPFCVARDGGIYTREEVRSWGRLGDWRGKIVGTDESTIFIYLGGYRCRHWLVPEL